MSKKTINQTQFNEHVFNILLMYNAFVEFGDFEILQKKDVTQLEKEKIKNILKQITKFNEKLVQFGQNDQTSA